MNTMRTVALLCFGIIVLTGCPQARDHVFKKGGFVNLGVQQGFGPGEDHENYIECKEGVYVFLNDHTSEVFAKLGSPDVKQMNMDGIEEWTYTDLGVNVCFDSHWVKGWERFDK
ncbi:MAG: hypothetical protein JXD21_03900 [Candidatus Omnitrophica bacterium]|nr:hypothetical protein [Candidatus Omnitrophota bacterium]